MPLTEQVEAAAQALMARIVAEVEDWKRSGRLVLRKQKYTLRPNFSLHYTIDSTLMNFETEEGEEDSWDGENWQEFWTQRIEPLPEYKTFLQPAKPQSEQPNLIRWFASKVAYDAALGAAPARISENVAAIARDLAGKDWDYRVTMWLLGIRPAEDKVIVSDSLVIRKPVRADLQEKVLEQHTHYWHATHRPVNFSSIAELSVRASGPGEVQRLINAHITALRLFRLGSVSTSRYQVSSQSFSTLANFGIGGREHYARVVYEIAMQEVPLLSRFLQAVIPLIPPEDAQQSTQTDYMATALKWYSEAVLGSAPNEAIVASAIACLEALFLGDNPSTEIAYLLAQRTALLFRLFGSNPTDILSTMKAGYKVRSRHVHGATPKKIPPAEMTRILNNLCEYARVGCLIWLQLTALHKHERTDLLQTINLALIDDDARHQLSEWCRAVEFGRKEQTASQ